MSAWGEGANPWGQTPVDLKEEAQKAEHEGSLAMPAPTGSEQDFPSLKQGASKAPTSKRKENKKGAKTLSLQELHGSNAADSASTQGAGTYKPPPARAQQQSSTKIFDVDDNIVLPTAPREKSPEEQPTGALGGAFRRGPGQGQERGGFFEDEESMRKQDESFSSRADEAADWKSKPGPPSQQQEKPKRGAGGGFDEDRPTPGKADEAETWIKKKPPPPPGSSSREPAKPEGPSAEPAKADASDSWRPKKPAPPPASGGGGAFGPPRRAEEPRKGPDDDVWIKKKPPPPPPRSTESDSWRK